MPIYVYKCSSCGFAKDVLQKMSDAPLTVCPSCGKATFSKQLTAAGFQLKGSGWYVTDFRDGHNGSASSHHADSSGDDAAKSEGAAPPAANEATPAPAASAASTSASAAPPDSGSGSSSND